VQVPVGQAPEETPLFGQLVVVPLGQHRPEMHWVLGWAQVFADVQAPADAALLGQVAATLGQH